MRQFLVMKLVCRACGANLELSPAPVDNPKYAEGEPTGADMAEVAVYVNPCRCTMKPLEDVRQAIQTIIQVADGK